MPGVSRLRSLAAVVVLAAAAFRSITGCSDANGARDDADAASGLEASTVQTSCGHSPSDAMPSCMPICNTAAVLSVLRSTQTPAPLTGGTIAPGLYYVTAVTDYFPADSGVEAGASTQTVQETVSLRTTPSGGVDTSTGARNGSQEMTRSYEFVAAGASIIVTQVCPPLPQQEVIPYAAPHDQFIIDLSQTTLAGASVERKVLTLQAP